MIYKLRTKKISVTAILLIMAALSCTPDAEKRFNRGAELYSMGKTDEARNEFAAGLLAFSSKKSFSDQAVSACDNAFYVTGKDKIKFLFPAEVKIKISSDYNIISCDPASNRYALSNGTDINVYDSEGSLIKIIAPLEDNSKKIMAVSSGGENIIYYIDPYIYTCDITSAAARTLTGGKFTRPHSDPFYSVNLYKSGGFLAAVVGIAGIYHLSVIDPERNLIIIKDKTISSLKILYHGDDIYYMSGKAGDRALNRLSVKSQKSATLKKIGDLSDVEFSPAGLLYETSAGLNFYDYEKGTDEAIPFEYKLAGGAGGHPLLKYNDDYYVVDMKIFGEKIVYLKNIAQKIFSGEQSAKQQDMP